MERREMLRKAALAGAGVWVAPQVIRSGVAAAAAGSGEVTRAGVPSPPSIDTTTTGQARLIYRRPDLYGTGFRPNTDVDVWNGAGYNLTGWRPARSDASGTFRIPFDLRATSSALASDGTNVVRLDPIG